jgi:hypothetical protein
MLNTHILLVALPLHLDDLIILLLLVSQLPFVLLLTLETCLQFA